MGETIPYWTRRHALLQSGDSTRCSHQFCVMLPGRHLKKGVASLPPPPPAPPLLAPSLGWPPRDGLVSALKLPTPGWPLEERRETPPRHFFVGGGGGCEGGGARSGGNFGGRGTWAGVWVDGEGLGVGVFMEGEVLGPGFWVEPQTSLTSNFRSVFIRERRCGPDDSIRCWTFYRCAPRVARPDNYRIIPLVLACVFLCRIFS